MKGILHVEHVNPSLIFEQLHSVPLYMLYLAIPEHLLYSPPPVANTAIVKQILHTCVCPKGTFLESGFLFHEEGHYVVVIAAQKFIFKPNG